MGGRAPSVYVADWTVTSIQAGTAVIQPCFSSLKSKAYDIVSERLGTGVAAASEFIAWTCSRKSSACLASTKLASGTKFGFLLDALQYGAPPHGGIALGVDRVVMILRNTTNIRDVIAFPKTQSGADLMCGAPSVIEDRQLREANIRLAVAAPKIESAKVSEH